MTTSQHGVQTSGDANILIGYVILVCALVGASILVLFGDATQAMSRFIYLKLDLPAFSIATLIAVCSVIFCYLLPIKRIPQNNFRYPNIKPWHIALVTFVVLAVSIGPIYHNFTFSMDEYMTRFQAEIFAAGRLAGEVPEEWRPLGRALHHSFAPVDTASGLVYSSYRPGMAAIYALFDLVGLGPYSSAMLSAGSIILVASIAQRLWPQSHSAPLVAALLLATSQQVLVTGLTSYAMSGHLFFNLLWLRLFLVGRLWAYGLAAIVGVATAALHQVHLHFFFAAPFLLTFLRPLRLKLIVFYGAVSLVGHFLIVSWDQVALGMTATNAGLDNGTGFLERVVGILRVPGSFEISSVTALIVRLFAWQNLALVPLLVIAARYASWSTPMLLLAASAAFSILPYLALMPDQGHGWGYRYLHGLIGNIVLIATAGWVAVESMAEQRRQRIVMALLVAGSLSITVMLPLRAMQVERMVAPFAEGYEFVRTIDADIVIVDTPTVYYGQDLVRNDPFLRNRPILLNIRHLDSSQVNRLCGTYSVALVDGNDLTKFGLIRLSPPISPPPGRPEILERINTSQCAGS